MSLKMYTNAFLRIHASLRAKNIVALVLLSFSLALPASLRAQDSEDASIELELAIVSNYVWRGEDLFQDKAVQDKKVPGANTGAPAFQPSITFYPEEEGLYFNIWASYAVSARDDKDTDGDGMVTSASDSASDPCHDDYEGDLTCEDNGLKRSDEVDYTIGYEKESRIGTIGFGILNYSYTYPKGKSASDTEIFFSYSPAGDTLSNFYLNAYSGIGSATDYYQIGYAYDLDISDDLSLSFDIAMGYQIDTNVTGVKDYTASVFLGMYGIDIGLNAAIRGKSEFYDDDDDPTDFKVEDPETGELKKLPRTIWWIYLGHTQEF